MKTNEPVGASLSAQTTQLGMCIRVGEKHTGPHAKLDDCVFWRFHYAGDHLRQIYEAEVLHRWMDENEQKWFQLGADFALSRTVKFASLGGAAQDLSAQTPQTNRELARRKAWNELTRKGDPARLPNPFSTGFNSGWDAAFGGAAQEGDCPCGATVVRKSDSANKSKLCADCAAQEEAPSSHDWIHEDELPADYPYHAMFPYSIIPGGIGCRVFPRLPERVKVEEEAGAPPVVEYRSFCKICHRAIRLWSGTRETGDWVHAEQNVSRDHWAVPFEDRESKK